MFWFVAAVVGAAILVPGLIHGWTPEDKETTLVQAAIIGIACGGVLLLMFQGDPYKFAFAVAIALAMVRIYPGDEESMQTVRSFFGVHKILRVVGRPASRAAARHHRAWRAEGGGRGRQAA